MRPPPLLSGLVALMLSAGPALAQTDYPLTLDNCGFAVTLPAAPERVVTIKSTATEMLLALGLGERIVGVARYVVDDDDATHAEFAALIEDGHQGRGLGTALVRHLAVAAREAGIRALAGDVLAERAVEILRRFAEGEPGDHGHGRQDEVTAAEPRPRWLLLHDCLLGR